jgi:hypothetical protein
VNRLDVEFRHQAALAGLRQDADPVRYRQALDWFQAGALATMVANADVARTVALRQPERPPNQPTMCGRCDYDEAEGFLVAQCMACRATDDRATVKMRGVPLRLY